MQLISHLQSYKSIRPRSSFNVEDRFGSLAALAKGRSGLIVDDVDGHRHLARRGAISRLAGPKRLVQLSTLLAGSLPLLIQVLRQIGNMNASCALLACFEPGDRELDLSGKNLPLKHVRGEVGEVVGTHLVDWDDGAAVVLRH